MKLHLGLFMCLFLSIITKSQTLIVDGKITDSVNQQLASATIIATGKNAQGISFALTDIDGNYVFKLSKKGNYNLEVSHLGYQTQFLNISIQKDTTLNFTLKESAESLDAVIIDYKYDPVQIKKDTTTYNVAAFINGDEKKLQDLLKKLPGLEVNDDGDIFFNGKRVTNLMLENEKFFNGGTRLTSKNLPADVVDQIEIIEDFHEVAILKGQDYSDQIALNIRIKKDRQSFWFGELKAGAGVTDRYEVNPSVFYYSKKVRFNYLGNVTNSGEAVFTLEDYINFKGGYSALLSNSNTIDYNSPLLKSDRDRNYFFDRTIFNAGNLLTKFNEKSKLTTTILFLDNKTQRASQTSLRFNNNTGSNDEELRSTTSGESGYLLDADLSYEYDPNRNESLKIDTQIKADGLDGTNNLISLIQDNRETIDINGNSDSFKLTQQTRYVKSINDETTLQLNQGLSFNSINNDVNYLGSEPFFDNSGITALNSFQNLFQVIDEKPFDITADGKLTTRLDNLNQIYFTGFVSYNHNDYSTQLFGLNSQQDNPIDGFINNLTYKYFQTTAGIGYRTKIKELILEAEVKLAYYNLNAKQQENDQPGAGVDRVTPLFLLKLDYDLNDKNEFRLELKNDNRYGTAANYATDLRLIGFNSIYGGNENLTGQDIYTASLGWTHSFRLGKSLITNLNYQYTDDPIRSATIINQNELQSTIQNISRPEKSIRLYSSYFYNSRKSISYSLGLNASIRNYSRSVNSILTDFDNYNYGANLNLRSKFEKAPNFELSANYSLGIVNSDTFDTDYQNLTANLESSYYLFKGFKIHSDLYFNDVRTGLNEQQPFFRWNAGLQYQKENSSFIYSINTYNLLDDQLRSTSSSSEFVFSQTDYRLQEFTALASIAWKF